MQTEFSVSSLLRHNVDKSRTFRFWQKSNFTKVLMRKISTATPSLNWLISVKFTAPCRLCFSLNLPAPPPPHQERSGVCTHHVKHAVCACVRCIFIYRYALFVHVIVWRIFNPSSPSLSHQGVSGSVLYGGPDSD